MPILEWESVASSNDDFQTTCGTYRLFSHGFYGAYQATKLVGDGKWQNITEEEFGLEEAKKACERYNYYLKEGIKDA